jgi:hypothetical protein
MQFKSVFKSFQLQILSGLQPDTKLSSFQSNSDTKLSGFRTQNCPVFKGLKDVPIQRVFMGKKTPFFYAIDSNTSRGIQGSKSPQSTPVRGLLKGKIDQFYNPIRAQSRSKSGLKSSPCSKDKIAQYSKVISTTYFAVESGLKFDLFHSTNLQFCFCFKWLLPYKRIQNFMRFSFATT